MMRWRRQGTECHGHEQATMTLTFSGKDVHQMSHDKPQGAASQIRVDMLSSTPSPIAFDLAPGDQSHQELTAAKIYPGHFCFSQ